MKIFKYVTVLLAVAAMSVAFTSCSKENDITGNPIADHTQDVDGKQDYWISFTLNPGSLNAEAIALYHATFAEQIYPEAYAKGEHEINFLEHPMYVTEEYARTNFNNIKAIPSSENDIVQKVMKPVALSAKTKDFDVVMTLSKDNMTTVLDTYTFRGQEVLADVTFNE
jgi:hypothetical protein